jgi:hypothetical protein
MKTKTPFKQASAPLILQINRMMEAFAKSNDERDYYLDRQEGFILYADLDKTEELLNALAEEVVINKERYLSLPKMTFYEAKKLMENFVHEKVYDIDTKEKLMDVIQSRDPREHFLEFIYDHHTELEKWQQYYQERSRIRIIEWLRGKKLNFVFEEDLDLMKNLLEKVKNTFFDAKPPKDVVAARKVLDLKAKTYYSNEALNPRPKRGRPPKQQQKVEIEPQITCDIFTTVPTHVQTFLFTPDVSHPSMVSFSDKYDTEEEFLASMRGQSKSTQDMQLESLNKKLAALRKLATGEVDAPVLDSEESISALSRSLIEDDEGNSKIHDLIESSVSPKKIPRSKSVAKKKKSPEVSEKPPIKKAVAKKAPAKKGVEKKETVKKPPVKSPLAKKVPAKKKVTRSKS